MPHTGERRARLGPAEIADDLKRATGRQSLPGFLAEMLARRMAANAPVTLISCDNIPGNGHILQNVVSSFADAADKKLAGWIADNVRFPSTMVDRIVPATRPEDLARVEEIAGYRDEGVVVGEPFRQWVIEDDFNRPRPRWDIAGAEFVKDVEPYEFVKMRVLNACQTALSYLGALSGLGTTCDDVHDPLLRDFAARMILDETAAVLPDVPSMQVGPYLKLTLVAARQSGDPPLEPPDRDRRFAEDQPAHPAAAARPHGEGPRLAAAGDRRCRLGRLSREIAAGLRRGVGGERSDHAVRRRHRAAIFRRHRRLREALHRQPRDLRRRAGGGRRLHRPRRFGFARLLADGVADRSAARWNEAPLG